MPAGHHEGARRMRAITTAARTGRRLAGRATSPARQVPSFLVVGAKRSGSTSLYEYVIRHPDVAPCRVKKGSHYFDVCYSRGWNWYRSNFPLALPVGGGRRVITGEASPYYMFHPLAPARIAAALPQVKLIAVLRDPVDRAYSHYQYEVRRGFEDLPIAAALDREPERLAGEEERMVAEPGYQSFEHRHHGYLARGRYAEQLERIWELVPREQVLVLQSESLFADPDRSMARVWAFLGLSPCTLGDVPAFKAGRYDDIPAEVRARLSAYYEEPNRRLYAAAGIDFCWPATTPAPDLERSTP